MHRLVGTLTLLVALLLTVTLTACEEESVLLGVDECAPSDCGAALAVPRRQCANGTTGGYTGRCLREEALTTCHWEILACPPLPSCEAADCGVFPAAYTAGEAESVECRRATDGVCRWTVTELPGCEPTDCGSAPEHASAMICAGGVLGGFTGRCIIGPMGECTWELTDCELTPPTSGVADTACALEECGSQPGDDRFACTDGTAAGNTGRCERQTDGSCTWEWLECAPALACETDADCGASSFCDRSATACDLETAGTCTLRPSACPTYTDSSPRAVCGCDGLTYDGACEAQQYGVSVASLGPCR